jgi:hypothetical protein
MSSLRHNIQTIILAALAAAGIGLVVVATRWGVGTSADSAGYISIARNLLAGDGYHDLYGDPAAIWPPGYPLSLALVGLTGADPLAVARWLNALLFAVNVALVGLILGRCARSRWLPLFGAFIAVTSVDMLTIHSMAWSEPLFICLGLVGMLCIAVYARRPGRRLLVATAGVVALAAFTRYAGLALIAAGGLVVLFSSSQPIRRRVIDAALFGAVACLPVAAWAVRNAVVTGSSTARALLFHPITSHQVRTVFKTTSLWLLPAWVPYGVRAVALIAAVVAMALVAYATARGRRDTAQPDAPRPLAHLHRVLALFLAIYALVLIVSVSFLDRYTVLTLRGMAPAFLPALILAVCLVDRLIERLHRRAVTTALAAVCLVFAAWYANRAFWWIDRIHGEGLGFSSRAWRASGLIDRVQALGPDLTIYTNAVDAIFIRTQRPARQVPAKRLTAQHGHRLNERFARDLADLRCELEAHGGVIVFFTGDKVRGRGYLASEDDLTAAIPLRVRTQAADGVIYELDEQPSETAPP